MKNERGTPKSGANDAIKLIPVLKSQVTPLKNHLIMSGPLFSSPLRLEGSLKVSVNMILKRGFIFLIEQVEQSLLLLIERKIAVCSALLAQKGVIGFLDPNSLCLACLEVFACTCQDQMNMGLVGVLSLVSVDHSVPMKVSALAFFQVMYHISRPLAKIVNVFVLTGREYELMIAHTAAGMTHHIVDRIFPVDMVTLDSEERTVFSCFLLPERAVLIVLEVCSETGTNGLGWFSWDILMNDDRKGI